MMVALMATKIHQNIHTWDCIAIYTLECQIFALLVEISKGESHIAEMAVSPSCLFLPLCSQLF